MFVILKSNISDAYYFCFFVIICLNSQSGLAERTYVSWESYSENGLPPMYAADNFTDCQKQEGRFCKVETFIKANDLTSNLAKQIKISNEIGYRFSRSTIMKMACIPKNMVATSKIRNYIKTKMESEFQDYNLTVEINRYECDVTRSLDSYDVLYLLFLVMYVFLISKATVYHIKRKKKPDFPISTYHKWLNIFSILNNWKKVNETNENSDFKKLRCVQGLRFFNMMLIIGVHTRISFLYFFLDNPKDLEQTNSNKILQYFAITDMYLVQIFFVVSSFLLTNQIYEIHKKYGHFSLAHCVKLYINRIFRFLPTLTILIIALFPTIKLFPRGTYILELINYSSDNCSNSWWATVFQLNFLYPFSKMCLQGTWYLSTDTVLYVTTIVILYTQLKLNLDLKKVLLVTFTGLSIVFAYIIYSENHQTMYRPFPEHMKKMLHSTELQALYISPFSNWSTCCVGMGTGAIYFHTKNLEIKPRPILRMIWLVTTVFLPVAVIYASSLEYNLFTRAVIGPLLKPAFALAFGVCILGMSHGLGGFFKHILEWNFAVKMSVFTYCTYLCHFFVVFIRPGFSRQLIHYESYDMLVHHVQNISSSILFGILLTVTVEYPWVTLQKMFIPQIGEPKSRKQK